MKIQINKKLVFDYNKPPNIIAEISGNHNGNKKRFLNLIKSAHKNGADLVKIQTYEPDDITLKKNNFKIAAGIWKGKNLWELYKKTCTPYAWHKDAFDLAKKLKINLFSTPFSVRALNLLEKYNTKLYKISSFEITDYHLIDSMAKTKKPLIISTGLSTTEEIKKALKIINKYHNQVIILHCVSDYPTDLKNTNLKRIQELKKIFKNNLIGLSDHTNDIVSSLSATTLGVVAIEKHIKLSDKIKTEDSKFSITPNKLYNLKKLSEEIFVSLDKNKPKKIDKKNLIFRRSIYANSNIPKNKKIKKNDLKILRPKIGICASKYFITLNKVTKKFIKKNSPIFNKDLK